MLELLWASPFMKTFRVLQPSLGSSSLHEVSGQISHYLVRYRARHSRAGSCCYVTLAVLELTVYQAGLQPSSSPASAPRCWGERAELHHKPEDNCCRLLFSWGI